MSTPSAHTGVPFGGLPALPRPPHVLFSPLFCCSDAKMYVPRKLRHAEYQCIALDSSLPPRFTSTSVRVPAILQQRDVLY
jgi:hypothetical protein